MKVASAAARRQAVLGIVLALALTGVELAGADHPPPPGFAVLAIATAGWCAAVSVTRWRVRHRRRSGQLGVTAAVSGAGGLVAGLALVAQAAALHGVQIDLQSLVGVAVTTSLAVSGGACIALGSWFVVDRPATSNRR